jgi:hypothetical protein
MNPVPLVLLVGGFSLAGFVATKPDTAREYLAKAGLGNALEPLVGILGGKQGTPKTSPKAAEEAPSKPTPPPEAAKEAPKADAAPKAAAPKAAAPKAEDPAAYAAPVNKSKSSDGPSPAAKAMKAAEEDLRVQLSTKVASAVGAACGLVLSSNHHPCPLLLPHALSLPSQLEALDGVALGASQLRATLAADLLADLEDLDRAALKYRLGNLTNELRERAKWEALRSHDAWRRAEVEAASALDQAMLQAKTDITRKHLQQVRREHTRGAIVFKARDAASLPLDHWPGCSHVPPLTAVPGPGRR